MSIHIKWKQKSQKKKKEFLGDKLKLVSTTCRALSSAAPPASPDWSRSSFYFIFCTCCLALSPPPNLLVKVYLSFPTWVPPPTEHFPDITVRSKAQGMDCTPSILINIHFTGLRWSTLPPPWRQVQGGVGTWSCIASCLLLSKRDTPQSSIKETGKAEACQTRIA